MVGNNGKWHLSARIAVLSCYFRPCHPAKTGQLQRRLLLLGGMLDRKTSCNELNSNDSPTQSAASLTIISPFRQTLDNKSWPKNNTPQSFQLESMQKSLVCPKPQAECGSGNGESSKTGKCSPKHFAMIG
eukprot:gnl/MRDRNA2_/MRDRNA2_118613_c0_seq1.p1 gnl/MRDRNA2_/MRDRNA2_118613_c0~~gnl/MRDRNA2_/MRDRNA2_118613_c0_seq1.p1  ORF type:complete len:130 (+),score=3.19 gnl/MRDRNA2_/MRDRNA2_118613_c0_seq1:93-482(+)